MRDTVGGDTPNIRAICAAVFRPEITASAISRRLGGRGWRVVTAPAGLTRMSALSDDASAPCDLIAHGPAAYSAVPFGITTIFGGRCVDPMRQNRSDRPAGVLASEEMV